MTIELATRPCAVAGSKGISANALGGVQPVSAFEGIASLQASLAGVLKVTTMDGTPVVITGAIRKRLFAVLLRAPGMSLSNTRLADLLCDHVADPNESLRQHRHQLKKLLVGFGAAVHASDGATSLVGVADVTPKKLSLRDEFFCDACEQPHPGEAFEDWLRTERMAVGANDTITERSHAPAERRTVRIGLMSDATEATDAHTKAISNWVACCLRDTFLSNDFVHFSDLRSAPEERAGMDLWVEVQVSHLSPDVQVSIAAFSDPHRHCHFSRNVRYAVDGSRKIDHETLSSFISTCVSAIERVGARLWRQDLLAWDAAPLYEIVSRMFDLQSRSVSGAVAALETFEDSPQHASVLAWQAFGKMLLKGERLVSDTASVHDEVEDLLYRAREMEPDNPTALAVSAHFQAFMRRDLNEAATLSELSLARAPHSPFARDVRAMLEIYGGRVSEGLEQARIASRLANPTPLRHYVDGSLVVGASLAGDYEAAILMGERILRARPGFLPVMRHLAACYGALERRSELIELMDDLRLLDPAFGRTEMLDPAYALPSEKSRALIVGMLQAQGLFEGK